MSDRTDGAAELREDRLDLRLAPAAAGVWGCSFAASMQSPVPVLVCLIGALALGLWGAVRLRRERAGVVARSWGPGLCMAAVAMIAACVVAGARQSQRLDSPLLAAAESSAYVEVVATVSGDAKPLKSGVTGPRVIVPVTVTSLTYRGSTVQLSRPAVVLGAAADWARIMPSQEITLAGTAAPSLTPDQQDAAIFGRGPPTLVGDPTWVQHTATTIRTSLAASADRTLPHDAAGLIVALVDGDTSGIDPVVEADFKQLGLTHLLAVSGANCAIVTGAVLWLTRRLRLPFAAQVGCTAFGLLAFVIIARPEPSVLRAAAMGVVTLVALASGRVRAAVPALAGSVLVLLIVSPGLATSAGFALSVAATAGIIVLAPTWTARWRARMPFPVAAAIAVAASAGVATAPILILLNPVINLISIPANVAAAPAVPFATVFGVLAALCAPWWPWAADLLVWCGGVAVRWLLTVSAVGNRLPEAQFRWPVGVLGMVLLICALLAGAAVLRLTRTRPVTRAVTVGIVVGSMLLSIPVRAVLRPWPPPDWLVVACDVGQGDALVIRAGPSAAVMIDVGPEPVMVERCLRELGVDRIPLLLLSHLHLDHIGGLDAVLGRREVGEIGISALREPAEAYSQLTEDAAEAGVPVRTPVLGEVRTVGAVQVQVIGPLAMRLETRSDPNNNSLLVRVQIDRISILFAGDAEVEEQAEYDGQPGLLDVDVLKVPHHGSAYQDPDFLAATSADVALVSVGAGNTYGHPSPLTVGELMKLGMRTYRTDTSGDVALSVANGQIVVTTNPTAQ